MARAVTVQLYGNQSRIDAKRCDRFLQADFRGLILSGGQIDNFRIADHPGLIELRPAKGQTPPRGGPTSSSNPSRKKPRKQSLSRLLKCVALSSTRSLLPCLKSVPVVPEELSKADWFAAENLLHFSSHLCSFALAIEPL